MAIIHCLKVWRHNLLGSHLTILTDNFATSYFQTKKKLSPKQTRWQDFLAEFDYELVYKPRRMNVVVDALIRKAELATISHPQTNLFEKNKGRIRVRLNDNEFGAIGNGKAKLDNFG